MSSETTQSSSISPVEQTKAKQMQISAYVELSFSSPPQSFTLIDPLSNKTLIELTDLSESEWSGELLISADAYSIEYLVAATWSNNDAQQKNFAHITLSPDQKDDASATLFSDEAIDSSATFTWHSH